MSTVYTTGYWVPFEGKSDEFVDAWQEFAAWSSSLDGAGRATLASDERNSGAYVSFMTWESWNHMRAWKESEEFKPRMSKVQAFIDKFSPTELREVARCDAGAVVS